MQSNILKYLLTETYKSPVFGDSFGPNVSLKTAEVSQQINDILQLFSQDFSKALTVGMPGATPQQINAIVSQIAPKTVTFCPALAAGEIKDVQRLSAAAMAIAIMYWGDQTMDRGDKAMPLAIEVFTGQKPAVPKELAKTVQAQAAALALIENYVAKLARPEDRASVYACFWEQVLANEVRVQKLSHDYLKAKNGNAFIKKHARPLVDYIVTDAGFPSVSTTLYAIYRAHNPSLPSLKTLYADQTMNNLLQICNVVVRIIDELGDWEADSGKFPEWGSFNINPFNQNEPTFVKELLDRGFIDDQRVFEAILSFHDNPKTQGQKADFIIESLLQHARNYIASLPQTTKNEFGQYVVLCKRVLEIGYVNRVGDIVMGQDK